MKLFGVLVALSLVAVCQSCKDKIECKDECPDGYHAQCIDTACKCPPHSCKVPTDCPKGNESGCPPNSTTKCQADVCICKRSDSHTKTVKH